jgi:NH3-dependent NAD+ synthetase
VHNELWDHLAWAFAYHRHPTAEQLERAVRAAELYLSVDYADLDSFLHRDEGEERCEEEFVAEHVVSFRSWARADTGASCCVDKDINIYVGLTEMQRKWYRSGEAVNTA